MIYIFSLNHYKFIKSQHQQKIYDNNIKQFNCYNNYIYYRNNLFIKY